MMTMMMAAALAAQPAIAPATPPAQHAAMQMADQASSQHPATNEECCCKDKMAKMQEGQEAKHEGHSGQ